MRIGRDESEELQSLRRDLVDPVKSFLTEVRRDTVGDAKRFYSAQAQKGMRSAQTARDKAKARAAAIRREQEEMQRRRKALMKRGMIVFALLALFCIVVITAALSAHAEEPELLRLGEARLAAVPPDYEGAAQCYRRAGAGGCAEAYFRLAEMYEKGLLNVGNPCTDDLEALGRAEAQKYYTLAARGGWEPAQQKISESFQSITPEEARALMEEDPACIILDVRTDAEYAAGHIPGAVCIPVETITAPPELLPEYDRTILVYCRSGRRSLEAARKLAGLGYTAVMDFGGILDWTGELIASEPPAP